MVWYNNIDKEYSTNSKHPATCYPVFLVRHYSGSEWLNVSGVTMKKTWIKVKRGFLQPEHRTKMGIRVWLYLYIIDQADWETGCVLEWKDKNAADELQMPMSTLRQQRQELEELGYITCIQQGYSQKILIMKWIDPRSYGGEELNKPEGNDEGKVESNNKGNNKGTEKSVPLHINHISQTTNHKSLNTSANADTVYEPFNIQADMPQSFVDEYAPKKKGKDPRYNHVAYSVYYSITKRKPNQILVDDIIDIFGDSPDVEKARKCYREGIARGDNPQAANWIYWYRDGVPGYTKKSNEPAPFRPTTPDSDIYDAIIR